MFKWNAALSIRNQQTLVNNDAAATFKAHLAATSQVLRSLLAALVSRKSVEGSFVDHSKQLDALVCPEAFKTNYWDISFNLAHSTTIPLLEQWNATSEELTAVRMAASTEDLIDRLTATGVDVELDPIQVARDNREKLRHALLRFQQIGLAWALGVDYPNPTDWESRVESYIDHLSVELETTAFVRIWSAQDIWSLLRKLPVDEPSVAFWSLVAAASSLDDLVARLGLSANSLDTAKAKLEALREDARRRKRVIEVCGREFDGSEDNLSSLWTHICSGLPNVALNDLTPVDLNKLSALENIATQLRGKRKIGESTNKPKQKYLSKSMENLVGLSGEIHAFRMLQNTYGTPTVSASSWISGNSSLVFPDNEIDDGKGCDFMIALQDRTYYIEVKASEGDYENFTLGSSEIRLAMELAKKSRRRRKEIFLILRVSNTLTVTPSFQLLPNPYDQKYQTLFDIEEAGTRIRYNSKS
jgi:hypothetical protein